jgi:hypothetical protein
MQVLPFFAWFVARRKNWFAYFKEIHRLALVCTFGLAYLGLVLLLVWQALRGQSVIHPDAQTLTVAAVLLALSGLSSLGIATHAKRTATNRDGVGSSAVSRNAEHLLES